MDVRGLLRDNRRVLVAAGAGLAAVMVVIIGTSVALSRSRQARLTQDAGLRRAWENPDRLATRAEDVPRPRAESLLKAVVQVAMVTAGVRLVAPGTDRRALPARGHRGPQRAGSSARASRRSRAASSPAACAPRLSSQANTVRSTEPSVTLRVIDLLVDGDRAPGPVGRDPHPRRLQVVPPLEGDASEVPGEVVPHLRDAHGPDLPAVDQQEPLGGQAAMRSASRARCASRSTACAARSERACLVRVAPRRGGGTTGEQQESDRSHAPGAMLPRTRERCAAPHGCGGGPAH